MAYETLGSCKAFNDRKKSGADIYKSPGNDQIRSMMNSAGIGGKKFNEAAILLGYSKADVDANKMIVFGCATTGSRTRTTRFNWFGNDQLGPWSQYYDTATEFDKVARAKGMSPGYRTLRIKAFH